MQSILFGVVRLTPTSLRLNDFSTTANFIANRYDICIVRTIYTCWVIFSSSSHITCIHYHIHTCQTSTKINFFHLPLISAWRIINARLWSLLYHFYWSPAVRWYIWFYFFVVVSTNNIQRGRLDSAHSARINTMATIIRCIRV